MARIDYSSDFTAFFRDMVPVDGARPIIPPFLAEWLSIAFPQPTGDPAARNIMDCRTKKEGKSTLAAGVSLYMGARKPYSEVIIVASDQDQAKDRVFRAAKYAVENGPLSAHVKVFKDILEFDNSSFIQAIPADWQGVSGGNPSCVIFDELHAWVYENQRRIFDELLIPPTVKAGCRWIASYAGFEGQSELLRSWWDMGLAGESVKNGEGLPIYFNQRASLLALIDTGPESWRMPWMTSQYIEEVRTAERPNTFRRLWLNEWVASESQFVDEMKWDGLESKELRPLLPGDDTRLVLGIDAATTNDNAAMVGTCWNAELKTVDVRHVRVWKPERGFLRLGKPTIDLAETIGREVTRLNEAGQIDCIVCDPYQLHSLILEWEKAGIKVIELAQNAGRIDSDQALFTAINGGALRHYGDKALTEHVKNAVAVETPRGFRIAKEKSSRKVDACVALSMSHWGSLEYQKGARVEKAEYIHNPFFDWPDDDPEGFEYDPELGWIKDWNHSPHPAGITFQNCRFRVTGCHACRRELEQVGYYAQQQAAADEHYDNSDIREGWEMNRQYWRNVIDEEAARKAEFKRNFFRNL